MQRAADSSPHRAAPARSCRRQRQRPWGDTCASYTQSQWPQNSIKLLARCPCLFALAHPWGQMVQARCMWRGRWPKKAGWLVLQNRAPNSHWCCTLPMEAIRCRTCRTCPPAGAPARLAGRPKPPAGTGAAAPAKQRRKVRARSSGSSKGASQPASRCTVEGAGRCSPRKTAALNVRGPGDWAAAAP